MQTKILKIVDADSEGLELVAEALRAGKLVVFPTETVYGLGANALDAKAVEKIFVAKGRPQDNPLIVHVSDKSQIYPLVTKVSEQAERLMNAFWPGALTIILPKSDLVSNEVSAGLDSVAVRLPANPIAQRLLKLAGVPVAAPSANLSGKPSPTTFEHVYNDLDGKVDYIIDGGACEVGLESTVVSLTGAIPILLRPGAVTLEQLQAVVGDVQMSDAILKTVGEDEKVASPGLKHKHYAPDAKVVLIHASKADFADYCNKSEEKNLWVMAFDEDLDMLKLPAVSYGSAENPKEQAHKLFARLRELDSDSKVSTIFIHAPSAEGVGLAVYNRLLRASSFNEVILPREKS